MNATQLTYLRTIVTAGITGLTVLYSIYPHYVWILPVISAAATLGIHAIPSISQTGGNPMTTPLTGAELMGISRPATPETVTVTSEPVTVAAVPAVSVDPTVADLLDNVIAGLQKIATMVRTETL